MDAVRSMKVRRWHDDRKQHTRESLSASFAYSIRVEK